MLSTGGWLSVALELRKNKNWGREILNYNLPPPECPHPKAWTPPHIPFVWTLEVSDIPVLCQPCGCLRGPLEGSSALNLDPSGLDIPCARSCWQSFLTVRDALGSPKPSPTPMLMKPPILVFLKHPTTLHLCSWSSLNLPPRGKVEFYGVGKSSC